MVSKISFLLVFFLFFAFTEEIAFKHFLFINVTKFKFFLFCSDEADMKKWNSVKYYDVYIISFLDWVILQRET